MLWFLWCVFSLGQKQDPKKPLEVYTVNAFASQMLARRLKARATAGKCKDAKFNQKRESRQC